MKVKCDSCGLCEARMLDYPDSVHFVCDECGHVDVVWKDNEYEEEDEGDDE
jgi:hypothetical protein